MPAGAAAGAGRQRGADEGSDQLGPWLDQCIRSGIAERVGFAQGLRGDDAAVTAALRDDWSQGPVEGHINRLKTIKRQLYGREGFALLRRRVLSETASAAREQAPTMHQMGGRPRIGHHSPGSVQSQRCRAASVHQATEQRLVAGARALLGRRFYALVRRWPRGLPRFRRPMHRSSASTTDVRSA